MQPRPVLTSLFIIAAAATANAQIFEGQTHTGMASAGGVPAAWADAETRLTGSVLASGGNSSASWDVGLLDPQTIRVQTQGFAGSLGSIREAGFHNDMTFTLTEAASFSLAGTLSRSGSSGSIAFRLSGAGILGVPTEPDGSLRLFAVDSPVSLSGTLTPGTYLLELDGVCQYLTQSSGFGANLTLTIPGPGGAALLVGPLVLVRRRRPRSE